MLQCVNDLADGKRKRSDEDDSKEEGANREEEASDGACNVRASNVRASNVRAKRSRKRSLLAGGKLLTGLWPAVAVAVSQSTNRAICAGVR